MYRAPAPTPAEVDSLCDPPYLPPQLLALKNIEC